jgi:hypothetical protein
MTVATFEKIFPSDLLTKRERVEHTLNFQPVDRAALHDQLSYNPGVIALYTGKDIQGYTYTARDVGAVIRQTLDACFLPVNPLGTGFTTDADGFTYNNDEWNASLVRRPFTDLAGAREFLHRKTRELETKSFDAADERARYQAYMRGLQELVGETVVIDFSLGTGFCDCWSRLGLENFSYLCAEDMNLLEGYIEAWTETSVRAVQAAGDPALSPVVLIAEDFASKNGSIFSPKLLRRLHFPYIRRLSDAWHACGLKVLYHSDGNWKSLVGELASTGVDGFYCLEPSLGMDILDLNKTWPNLVWAGGVDGVDLMERGRPEQVRDVVHRIIRATDTLHRGGIFIGTSSEVNPPIPPLNFKAMVDAVGELTNPQFE